VLRPSPGFKSLPARMDRSNERVAACCRLLGRGLGRSFERQLGSPLNAAAVNVRCQIAAIRSGCRSRNRELPYQLIAAMISSP